MPQELKGTRFGDIEVPDEAVVEFPAGLIGVGGRRFALLRRDEGGPFSWLQEIERTELALPVVDPFHFFPDYEVRIPDSEAERIGIVDPAKADVLAIVRAAPELEDFTINLLAPILVSEGVAHQVLNDSPRADLRAPLLSGLAGAAT